MSEEQKRAVQLQRVYIKDMSVEAPGVPAAFLEQSQPKINVELQNGATRIEERDEFEVTVTTTVTATRDDNTVYLVEATQAGIFTVVGFEGEELDQVLGAYCPGVIFPYLRETVSGMITRLSFPPFLLQPINFDALYREAKAKREQQDAKETSH